MCRKKTIVDPVLESLFEGRNEQQKKAITYFYGVVEEKKKKGCGCLRKKQKPADLDAEYVSLVKSMVENFHVESRALEALGIDLSQVSEINPITLKSYYYHDLCGNEYLVKRGKDLLWRSSMYQVTKLYFSNTQMFVYSITFDTRSNVKRESTVEIFYDDVVSFSVGKDTDEMKVEITQKGCLKKFKKGKTSYEYVNLDTDILTLCVKGDTLTYYMDSNEERDQILQALKAKIRDRK